MSDVHSLWRLRLGAREQLTSEMEAQSGGEQAEAEGLRECGAGVAAGQRARSSGRADDSWRNLCCSAGRGRGCSGG